MYRYLHCNRLSVGYDPEAITSGKKRFCIFRTDPSYVDEFYIAYSCMADDPFIQWNPEPVSDKTGISASGDCKYMGRHTDRCGI